MNPTRAYLSQKDNRDSMVLRYAPLVKRIALYLKARLPPMVQVDDLVQAGMIGLMEAARNYEGLQGASFETYASIRIRGAMLDEIRSDDWAPRAVHKNARSIASVINKLSHELGRQPRDSEVAARMQISIDEYHRMVADEAVSHFIGIDDLGVSEDVISVETDPESSMATPLSQISREQFASHLAAALKKLPEREQQVLSLYYNEGLNLKEIGAVIGVGESRVSQIMAQATVRIRAVLRDWIEDA